MSSPLGKKLGLHIIGEGAETEAEVAILRAAGCDAVQDYFFSQAVPALTVPIEADRIRRTAYSFTKRPKGAKPVRLVIS